MMEKKTVVVALGALGTASAVIIAVLSGALVIIDPEGWYFCEVEDTLQHCVSLSSSGRTCYLDNGTRDLCTSKGESGIWEWTSLTGIINGSNQSSNIITINNTQKTLFGDFKNSNDANNYISNVRNNLFYNYIIEKVEVRTENEYEIFWSFNIYNESGIYYHDFVSVFVPKIMTENEISDVINKKSSELASSWKPKISIRPKINLNVTGGGKI